MLLRTEDPRAMPEPTSQPSLEPSEGPGPTPEPTESPDPSSYPSLVDMPVALGEVTSALLNDRLYVVGERNSATLYLDLDTNSWKYGPQRPFLGNHMAGVVVNQHWYLIGGRLCQAGHV